MCRKILNYQMSYIPSTFIIQCSIFDILRIFDLFPKVVFTLIRDEPLFSIVNLVWVLYDELL